MTNRVFSDSCFAGKRALITGATGGIGSEVARLLAHSGANLVLSDRDEDSLESLSAALPGTHSWFAGDLSDPDMRGELVAEAGQLDFLLLAAGIYPEAPLSEISDENWNHVFNINMNSVFSLTRDLEAQINGGGAIVNFGSIAGARGSKNHSHYAATKGAIAAFSKSLALEFGEREIRVNTIAPGIIDTSMTRDLMASTGDTILQSTPLGRLGTAEEVAGTAVFLCSDLASFITGETIHVNGGFYMA